VLPVALPIGRATVLQLSHSSTHDMYVKNASLISNISLSALISSLGTGINLTYSVEILTKSLQPTGKQFAL